MTSWSASPRTRPPGTSRTPIWMVAVAAALLLAGGIFLIMHPFLSYWAFMVLATAGLALVGLTTRAGILVQQPTYLLWTIGAFLASFLVVRWLFPTIATTWVVTSMIAALVLNGLSRLLPVLRRRYDQPVPGAAGRVGLILLGLTSFFFAATVAVWPLLFAGMLEAIFGIWFVVQAIRAALFILFKGRPATGHGSPASALTWGIVGVLSGGALVLGTNLLLSGDPAPLPDAFYTPPASVPPQPGQLINFESLADRGSGLTAGQTGWRILYTTTSATGLPGIASGTVVVADDYASRPDALPVLSISHGTTGIIPACAPSLAAQPLAGGALEATEIMIEQGWAAVTSDYVGLGTEGPHAYLVGPSAAHDVLSATMAAQQIPGLNLASSTVLWGHSQGGHGALWSAGQAAEYAPDLEVLGVAAMAPATDLFNLALDVQNAAAGKIVSAYIAQSWREVYPDLDIEANLLAQYRGTVAEVAANCFSSMDAIASIVRTSQMSGPVFRPEVFDAGSPIADQLVANSVSPQTSGLIEVPILVAQGLADSLVVAGMQEQWVADTCAAGQALDYRTYPGLDHMPLVEKGSPLTAELVVWTNDRLAGASPTNTCN